MVLAARTSSHVCMYVHNYFVSQWKQKIMPHFWLKDKIKVEDFTHAQPLRIYFNEFGIKIEKI